MAGRTARPARPSWEAPDNPAERGNSSTKPTKGILTFPGVASFLRRNSKKIGSLALILFTTGIVILTIVPARYAATALVLVDPRELHVTAEQDVLPGIGQDAAALQSLIEIAKSDGFLRPLIEKLGIADDDEIAGGEKNASRLLEKFRSHFEISRRGLTYVIAMTFTSNSPQQAARYANAAGVLGYYDTVVTQIFRTQAIWTASGDIGTQVAQVLPRDVMERVRGLVQNDGRPDDSVTADVAVGRQDRLNQTPSMVVVYKGRRQLLAPIPPPELLKSYFDELLTK